MDLLNFSEAPVTDEAIEEYEYHEYEPITCTNLNNPGEIRITIQNQDIFTHPCESYLLVEGRPTKNDGTRMLTPTSSHLQTTPLCIYLATSSTSCPNRK